MHDILLGKLKVMHDMLLGKFKMMHVDILFGKKE